MSPLGDVEGVCLDDRKPTRGMTRYMSAAEGRRHLSDVQFPGGSIDPKVEAALRFVESEGKRAIVTSLEANGSALAGKSGMPVYARHHFLVEELRGRRG